jgi:hypothetical protein
MNDAGLSKTGVALLDYELMAEKAAALGRAGERAELKVKRLRELAGDDHRRGRAVKEAAEAVYAYFIQRELCGLRRHDDIVRELKIPREVIARLGAA